MAFNPSSTIYLCNVPFDSTYKNQVYFGNATDQQNYFSNRVKKTFNDYLTVREKLPNGGSRSTIKLKMNIDTLRSLPCNYMFYRNENHGTKIFYAFITEFIYINENTTQLVFETDVYQTYLFDVTIKPSYVIREHSETDEKGDNIVPESFSFQDYNYSKIFTTSSLKKWGYLIASTEEYGTDLIRGKLMSGIYQGLYFYYYTDITSLNEFLDNLENEGGDCIVFIACIPEFCVNANNIVNEEGENTQGELMASSKPSEEEIEIDFGAYAFTFDGYEPKNNKLWTSPFCKMIVTNHNGNEVEYNLEDFNNQSYVTFSMYGDVSANPSVTLIPNNYKGLKENFDCGISISGFPQCAFNSDTFKLWLAKNQYGVALDTLGNVGNIIGGLVTSSSGVGMGVGMMQTMNGVSGVLSSINSVYQASKEPNRLHSGSAKNNLLTAMGYNVFDFYLQTIKREYAETVDNFFTMYGYQTNKLKVPNVSKRPYYNYVQTNDINIINKTDKYSVPNDDMKILKSVYNGGVTLWKHNATMFDYSVDNSPT